MVAKLSKNMFHGNQASYGILLLLFGLWLGLPHTYTKIWKSDCERRETLGRLRSIKSNMIVGFFLHIYTFGRVPSTVDYRYGKFTFIIEM